MNLNYKGHLSVYKYTIVQLISEKRAPGVTSKELLVTQEQSFATRIDYSRDTVIQRYQLHQLFANTTPFLSVPILEIVTSIFLPGVSHCGGFNPAPTPIKENCQLPCSSSVK